MVHIQLIFVCTTIYGTPWMYLRGLCYRSKAGLMRLCMFCVITLCLITTADVQSEIKLDLLPMWWAVLSLWKFNSWHWKGNYALGFWDGHFLFPVPKPVAYNLPVNWLLWTGIVILFTMDNWPLCVEFRCIQVFDLKPIKFRQNFSH